MSLDWHKLDRWITGESWVGSTLMENLSALCDDIGPRWATSPDEAKAAHYITDQMRKNGMTNVHLEEFDFDTWIPGRSELHVQGEPDSEVESIPLLFAPPVKLSAPVVDTGFGTEHELSRVRERLPGAIAILDAGYEPFTRPLPLANRLEMMAEAGVVSAVVVNPVGGRFLSYMSGSDWIDGDITSALRLPAILTTREEGARLRRLVNADTHLNIDVHTSFERATSINT